MSALSVLAQGAAHEPTATSYTIVLLLLWVVLIPGLVFGLVAYCVAQALGEREENREYLDSLRADAARPRR